MHPFLLASYEVHITNNFYVENSCKKNLIPCISVFRLVINSMSHTTLISNIA